MRFIVKIIIILTVIIGCSSKISNPIIYETGSLVIEQITPNVFKHVSYLQTNNFGNVACNGMIYITENKALVFDTPTSNNVSKELINWIEKTKKATINGVVVNHFHVDCLGGLKEFHSQNIPSYANNLTIDLAKKDSVTIPKNGFDKRLELNIGSNKTITLFLGEGHTRDNTVSYVENDKTLFGGCMIKSLDAPKGNLADANTSDWSTSVRNVQEVFPEVKNVIPGHGNVGDSKLLEYTIQLFKK